MKVLLCLLFLSAHLRAEEVVRIEAAKSDQERIRRLEMAVEQLQKKIFGAEIAKPALSTANGFTTCVIKTPFDGTFMATEPTEMAARASTLEKCNGKTMNSIYCVEKELKCGK